MLELASREGAEKLSSNCESSCPYGKYRYMYVVVVDDDNGNDDEIDVLRDQDANRSRDDR